MCDAVFKLYKFMGAVLLFIIIYDLKSHLINRWVFYRFRKLNCIFEMISKVKNLNLYIYYENRVLKSFFFHLETIKLNHLFCMNYIIKLIENNIHKAKVIKLYCFVEDILL